MVASAFSPWPLVETTVPKRHYRRIVDLGCGFGKSTWPFKKAFPDAEVIGVDLAAPCLALATEKASDQGLEIRFKQADCASTGLESGSADLVCSTMLIHEMPRPHLQATPAPVCPQRPRHRANAARATQRPDA